MKNKKKFSRSKFIEEYELTRDEYFFLPLEERMEYVQRKFGFILESIPNINDVKTIRGTIPYQFEEFFEQNGCRVEYFDFGFEETEIKRISNKKIAISEEAAVRLDDYIKLVAGAKADMFKKVLTEIYQAKIDALNKENIMPLESIDEEKILKEISKERIFSSDLPTEVKEYIMFCQLSSVMERIDNRGYANINSQASKDYFEYLTNQGYNCQNGPRLTKVQNKGIEK